MEESEKMTALKKAYAEIILNTAKEAAARIMVSERKAHQFHHDLSSTKDEALRLLLRLKQTMDFKVKEAETKSLNQQRRIEELEAQLQEAEDIVSNLRADLSEAHMKLEEMEKNQMHSGPVMMEKPEYEEGTAPQENVPAALASQENWLGNAANGPHIAKNSLEEYGYVSVPDVPSIIARSKEPELYRNGCTQRIRACEGNLLNGHFSLSGELADLKHEKTIREDKEDERVYTTSVGVDVKTIDSKEVKNVVKNSGKVPAIKSFRKKRKRAARIRRSNDSIVNKPVPPLAKESLSDKPDSLTCLAGSLDMLENLDNAVKGEQLHSPSTAPSNISEMGVAVDRGDDALTEVPVHAIDEDREVASSLVLIRQKSGFGDCVDVPSSNPELETTNPPSENLDVQVLDAGDFIPSPPPKDRVLKYTFQRKRKKEAISSDDSSLLNQENPLKRKPGKKPNGSLEAPKSSTSAESSRDSRRMAQVARQLISLSEKKWWK